MCGCLIELHCSRFWEGAQSSSGQAGLPSCPRCSSPRKSGPSLSHCHCVWFLNHHPPLFTCKPGVPTELEFAGHVQVWRLSASQVLLVTAAQNEEPLAPIFTPPTSVQGEICIPIAFSFTYSWTFPVSFPHPHAPQGQAYSCTLWTGPLSPSPS